MRPYLIGAMLLLAAGFAFTACSSLAGNGGKKLVINENVCLGIDLLRMKLGQETRIVLDNTQHSASQESLALNLPEFPVFVTSELPPNASVGPDFTTLQISALAGEKNSVTVKPIFTGDFTAFCVISLKQDTGGSVRQRQVTFQIID